tara:strand:- start:322 stop:495 length:174 start_codon:yes stop_codon:yes gene_type:complete
MRNDPNLSAAERNLKAKKRWVRRYRMTGLTKVEFLAGIIDLKTAMSQTAEERYGNKG